MSKPKRITRSKAIELLRSLPTSQIASVTFVARGDASANLPPYVRVMAIRTKVTKHLKGGHRPYESQDHGLMSVFEVVNKATALKRYRDQATHEIEEVEPQVSPAQSALEAARTELAAKGGPTAKGNKGRTAAVGVKERKLQALSTKLEHARLKISDPTAALTSELQAACGRRQDEITELTDVKIPQARTAIAAGDPDGSKAQALSELESELEETRERLARTREYLSDPEQSLLVRYRQINLAGLLALRIDGQDYKVTTPPQPAVPADAEPKTEDPEPTTGSK